MSNVTINGQEHDLADLRKNAQEGVENFQAAELELAFGIFGAEHIASAMRGMMHTILALVDEVENLRAAA